MLLPEERSCAFLLLSAWHAARTCTNAHTPRSARTQTRRRTHTQTHKYGHTDRIHLAWLSFTVARTWKTVDGVCRCACRSARPLARPPVRPSANRPAAGRRSDRQSARPPAARLPGPPVADGPLYIYIEHTAAQ